MTPIDVTDPDPFRGEDPIKMLRSMTMAFMILLSEQPNMSCEFSAASLASFPYDDFRLAATSDEDGSQTFMLIRESQVH